MWKKILIGIGVFVVALITLVLLATKSISDIANKQLEALRIGNYHLAYSFTSKAFQGQTSYDDFVRFVNKYAFLKNNKSASWPTREISNDTGKLIGTLTANDGAKTPVEYHFVRENGEWKIIGFGITQEPGVTSPQTKQVQQQSQAQPASETANPAFDVTRGEIYQVLVSDSVNATESVDKPKGVISRSVPKIYASAYILHAKAGLRIAAQLIHAKSGLKYDVPLAEASQNGNLVKDFVFTNNGNPWQPGNYVLNITTSNDQHATVHFKVQ